MRGAVAVVGVPVMSHVGTGRVNVTTGQNTVVRTVVVTFTTLALGVSAKFTEGYINAVDHSREGNLGLDFGDNQDCVNACGGDTDTSCLVRWADGHVIYCDMVGEDAMMLFLGHVDGVVVVEDGDGLGAGGGVAVFTLAVTDHDAEAVVREDLLHQPVRTFSLERVVGPVKGHIMRVSPAVTDTLTLIMEAAAVRVIHFDRGEVISTHRGLHKGTLQISHNHFTVFTSRSMTATFFPAFSILSVWVHLQTVFGWKEGGWLNTLIVPDYNMA